MMCLNCRAADFEHILKQSQKRNLTPAEGFLAPHVELFDTLDSMPTADLKDVVALFLYGKDAAFANFEAARCKAGEIGFAGVELLHESWDLHVILQAGFDRLQKESPILWMT